MAAPELPYTELLLPLPYKAWLLYILYCSSWYGGTWSSVLFLVVLFLSYPPQAITKQFAEILHFTLSFDDLKVGGHQFELGTTVIAVLELCQFVHLLK